MKVALKLVTGNKYDAKTILDLILPQRSTIYFGNWRWSDFRHVSVSLFDWKIALDNLCRILDESNILKAKGEYWEVYNAEEWIGVQISPYKGNIIISFVMTDRRYELWQPQLWQNLNELTKKNKLKTVYICDADDLWFEFKRQQDSHVEMPFIEGQNSMKIRQLKLKHGYGQVLELDDIFYPSCWAMWFYDLKVSQLTSIADFSCYRNEPCGEGRFVQLYENITDFALPESRVIQRAFRLETGIDQRKEKMIFWLKARNHNKWAEDC